MAVSVDPPGRNEALRQRWHLPFAVVSDPQGTTYLRDLDAWNPDERGGIAWPTLLLFDPSGAEVFRMRSADFADRPADDDILEAAQALDLGPLQVEPPPPTAPSQDDPGAFRTDAFGPYFRGIRFATMALAGRMEADEDRRAAQAMSSMAQSFLEAWSTRRKAAG